MKIYHAVSIDLARADEHTAPLRLTGVEGDSGTHVLELRLYCGGEAWPIPEDVSALISYARPDSTGGAYDTLPNGEQAWRAEGNVLYLELAPACFAVPTPPQRETYLSVTLLRGEQQLTTRRISLVVHNSIAGNEESGNVYTSFLSLIRQHIGDTSQLDSDTAQTVVDAVNEALRECRDGAVGVENVRISGDNELLVTLTDGRVKSAGNVSFSRINANLLDNWCFLDAVNQRGLSDHIDPDTIAIDRWRNSSNITTTGAYNKLTITCLAPYANLSQTIDRPTALNGQTVTASLLVTANSGDLVFALVRVREGVETVLAQAASDTTGLLSFTYTFSPYETLDSDALILRFGSGSTNIQGYSFTAVKLELGIQQTLAHKENGAWVLTEMPNYADQLLRCQRFFQLFRTQDKRPVYAQDFRPPMRAEPTFSTISIDGVTYYTAEAEL